MGSEPTPPAMTPALALTLADRLLAALSAGQVALRSGDVAALDAILQEADDIVARLPEVVGCLPADHRLRLRAAIRAARSQSAAALRGGGAARDRLTEIARIARGLRTYDQYGQASVLGNGHSAVQHRV